MSNDKLAPCPFAKTIYHLKGEIRARLEMVNDKTGVISESAKIIFQKDALEFEDAIELLQNTRPPQPEADCKEIIAVIDSFNLEDDFDIAARNKLRRKLQKASQPEGKHKLVCPGCGSDNIKIDTVCRKCGRCDAIKIIHTPTPLATKEEGKIYQPKRVDNNNWPRM